MRKPKILGAYDSKCEMCGGILYKLKTSMGVIYQCKCGNMYTKDRY